MNPQPKKRNRPKHYANARKFNGLYIWQIAQQLGVTLTALQLRTKKYGTPYWTPPSGHHVGSHGIASHPPERHGGSHWPEYKIHSAMLCRCYNPHHKQYKDYGGRGITVCDRWRQSFGAFIKDIGRRPKKPKNLTLERLDNDKGYEPGNVAWVSRSQNQQNTRSNNNLTWNGKTQCLTAWSREIGISQSAISHRLKEGVPLSIALTRPPIPGKRLR